MGNPTDSDFEAAARTTPRGLLRLTRASLALSPIADGLAGMAIAAPVMGWPPLDTAAIGLVCSFLLFCFGMAQNDLADRVRDRGSRRPLATGEVRVAHARMFVIASAIACVSLSFGLPPHAQRIVLALLLLISAYNLSPHHLGPIGPLALGSIRALDLTLGAAVAGGASSAIAPAIAYGATIAAISCVSRMEDGVWRPTRLRVIVATIIAAAGVIAAPWLVESSSRESTRFLCLIASLCWIVFVARAYRALPRGELTPGIPLARFVGACLSGILFIDASLAAAAGALVVSFVILLMFPIARALVRSLPPS